MSDDDTLILTDEEKAKILNKEEKKHDEADAETKSENSQD